MSGPTGEQGTADDVQAAKPTIWTTLNRSRIVQFVLSVQGQLILACGLLLYVDNRVIDILGSLVNNDTRIVGLNEAASRTDASLLAIINLHTKVISYHSEQLIALSAGAENSELLKNYVAQTNANLAAIEAATKEQKLQFDRLQIENDKAQLQARKELDDKGDRHTRTIITLFSILIAVNIFGAWMKSKSEKGQGSK